MPFPGFEPEVYGEKKEKATNLLDAIPRHNRFKLRCSLIRARMKMNLFTALALFSVVASALCFECGKNTCQNSETCCPGKREDEWHCCPFQMAKCCDNGEYCCPQFSTCSEEMGRCVIPMIPHRFERGWAWSPRVLKEPTRI
ncbi:hypothetical protein CDAR_315171 [Caerostris darwini]|uniref:Granulins domain-containing protein n=1 Tax=Caerostris darwini TaxID=1538125 RepID=A0AAV4TRK5_9ARAC|nr:hypothetical protein CDAR_315171 [Caerostris darwini]